MASGKATGKEVVEEKGPLLEVGGGSGEQRMERPVKRKVQWNDQDGSDLVEILEFDPSDGTESDDDEEDFMDTCICSIM